MTIHLEEFSIQDLADVVCNQLKPMAEKKKIEFQIEIAPNIPVIYQDQVKLRQVIFNLLSTALKFTYEHGFVTLKIAMDSQFLTIRVIDSGVGIALEDQEMIFEKFRQGRRSNRESVLTREHEGTGLGLSIVREFCRLMGGEVSLESRLGEGSAFTVRLPARHPEIDRNDQLTTSSVTRVDPARTRRPESRSFAAPRRVAAAASSAPRAWRGCRSAGSGTPTAWWEKCADRAAGPSESGGAACCGRHEIRGRGVAQSECTVSGPSRRKLRPPGPSPR